LRPILLGIVQMVVTICVLFLPAGTLAYPQGWAYFVLAIGAGIAMSFYLRRHDPTLLKRRSRTPFSEKSVSQRLVQLTVMLAFVCAIVLSSLAFRFGWSQVPVWLSAVGFVLVALGLLGYFLVFKENTFAAVTIGVEEGQSVISTGPYGVVRHPMYVAILLLLAGTPLALGSWLGLLFAIPVTIALVWRVVYEERVLREDLGGYTDYCGRVRFRLIPGLW
jgi:protein-S-isoprenylcysteine O-methyltransferase Ste14